MEQFVREVMSGRKRGFTAYAMRAGLSCAEWPYRFGVAAKNLAFDCGMREPFEVSIPVISVGNLTTGGTGKTPVVAFLANWFRDAGVRVGLLSRGYKSLDSQANDEKLVLDQLCPGVPHWLNPNRIASAKQAVAEGCELLILDDAFQHRRLHRDWDIVLVDATNPWGFGHCLPRGLLREPIHSMARANFVMVTRADLVSVDELTAIRTELVRHDHVGSVAELSFRPTVLSNSANESQPLSRVVGQRCLGFCGIGNPESFQQTLKQLGVNLVAWESFPDHHHYDAADLARLTDLAEKTSAEVLLTTQKDLVKLRTTNLSGRPVWSLQIGAEVVRGGPFLEQSLFRILQLVKDRNVGG